MVAKIAMRGPNKGKRIEVPKRESVRNAKGRIVYVESRKWAIEYTDIHNRRRTIGGYTDKTATKQKAAEIERHLARQSEHIIDVDYEHTDKPVDRHVADWLADLDRAGRANDYTRIVRGRINRLRRDLGWGKLSSIGPGRFTDWLALQHRDGLGQRTVNHYIETATAFCNWCVAQGRLERNPLVRVSKARVVEPRVVRRSATVDELRRLIEGAPKRALKYVVAVLTGLRRRELAALQWGDVILNDERPHIALRAHTTKSRRADSLALNDEVVGWLAEARPADWQATDRVFDSIPTDRTFKRDLERAGIPVEIDGRKLDLHALRTTLGTLLATSGASIREAMEQMRHTDVRLTTRVYTDPRLLDTHRAVSRLPRITPRPGQQLRATGTYGAVGMGSQNIRADIRDKVSATGRNRPVGAVTPDGTAEPKPAASRAGTTTYGAAAGVPQPITKRSGRDSNPRYGYPHTAFPVRPLQPLGHRSKRITTFSTTFNYPFRPVSGTMIGR